MDFNTWCLLIVSHWPRQRRKPCGQQQPNFMKSHHLMLTLLEPSSLCSVLYTIRAITKEPNTQYDDTATDLLTICGSCPVIYLNILFVDIGSVNGVQNSDALRWVPEDKRGRWSPRQKTGIVKLGTSENSGPCPTKRENKRLRTKNRMAVAI